jgi:hypothetical protein
VGYFGASDATIFSKRGSPRSGFQNGMSDIQPLTVRNGIKLDVGADFNQHVDRLIKAIRDLTGRRRPRSRRFLCH